jgi:ATP-dependent DNA helicase RecQ
MEMNEPVGTTTPLEILRSFWGHDQFRPLQEDIIHSVLSGKDTLALLPTGGGKSVCYQVPAMMMDGLCLVISPLIALMKDQVEGLRRKNITAFAIHSGLQRKEVINVLKVAGDSNCKFLFVSPERLETSLFKEYLPGLGVKLIAVDEAHCISQWGYDFRPPYLRIADLREELPGVPVLALTASATPEVQKDICDKLHFIQPGIFRQSFERPKLSYSVSRTEAKVQRITDILKKVPGSGIVYCKSRKRTREIADLLRMQQISADHYHAGLSTEERNTRQESWIRNETRVIVCTNAFGMGIDKPDVRIVIHADVPDCLENYYQEAGRAGRDTKMAYAVLLYDDRDLSDIHDLAGERFPEPSMVKGIYQSIANYLHVASSAGEGDSYDFDLPDFLKKFHLNGAAAVYSLRLLEQEGWLSFNEQVFRPSKLQFTCNKSELFDFEGAQPMLEPIIKCLLRTYEGIFDQPVFISEKLIANLLKKESREVTDQLHFLDRTGIVDYDPVKDKPQVQFLRNRIRTEDLSLDLPAIARRKEQFLQRVGQMRKYIHEEATCRSRIIASYFGDESVRSCGVCDNCLRLKSTDLSREEFDLLHHRILNVVKYEQLSITELVGRISGIRKEKLWKVIDFLQTENRIAVNDSGKVILK